MSYLPALLLLLLLLLLRCVFFRSPEDPDPSEEWPPSLITYEQYETELDEAISAHPKFGEWLSETRNYSVFTFDGSSDGFSYPDCQNSLSVKQLKDLYVTETNNKRIVNHAKRHTIKQKLKIRPKNLTEQQRLYDEENNAFKTAQKKWEDVRAHFYNQREWVRLRPVEPKKPDPEQVTQ